MKQKLPILYGFIKQHKSDIPKRCATIFWNTPVYSIGHLPTIKKKSTYPYLLQKNPVFLNWINLLSF